VRVVVCIKQVSHIYYPLAIDVSGKQLDPEKLVFMLNPYDEIALEQAARIKECYGNCEIVAVTLGLSPSEEILRYAFAMGADRMIRIDFESTDAWLTSLVLAHVIKDMEYDILLCGKKAIDSNAGQVGSFIAELLQLPQVSRIVGLKLFPEEKKAIAERYLGKGDRQLVECSLPALFTAEEGLNDPRYPPLGRRLMAEKENLEVIKMEFPEAHFDNEMDLTNFMSLSPPRPKPKKTFAPDSSLSASERMKMIMVGGITEKKSELLEGKAEDISRRIVEVLELEKII
jgi:electron transfer flavoprotein beta subunit